MKHFLPITLLSVCLIVAVRVDARRMAPPTDVEIRNILVEGRDPGQTYRAQFDAAARGTIYELSQCYQTAQANGFRGGDYYARLWVSARQVIRVTQLRVTGYVDLDQCTRATILRFQLPPETPASGVTVTLTVHYVPVVAPPSAPVSPPAVVPPATTAPSSPASSTCVAADPNCVVQSAGSFVPTFSVPNETLLEPTRRAVESVLPAAASQSCYSQSPNLQSATYQVQVSARGRPTVTLSRRIRVSGTRGSLGGACLTRALSRMRFEGSTRYRFTVRFDRAGVS